MEKRILRIPTVSYHDSINQGSGYKQGLFIFQAACETERMDPCVNEISLGETETIIIVDWICV